eukprot:CAMPEP_0202900914 /NCGR_PEP_ID=MMETSP1392-20130828/12108_1 /ASSEMBLY_ACC=CAM_ASM_000868 /TAXON_ID=225041 /ORGANISM="Chlamydomonas chlamydogama, Strain SAG 11-48b" /LENGTH=100 /DNA_ID=CAMNT_0049587371 /DNA_START=187 /DNA_END=489 /DNA_ORIENTATION=+
MLSKYSVPGGHGLQPCQHQAHHHPRAALQYGVRVVPHVVPLLMKGCSWADGSWEAAAAPEPCRKGGTVQLQGDEADCILGKLIPVRCCIVFLYGFLSFTS